jgi:hypothetical protein
MTRSRTLGPILPIGPNPFNTFSLLRFLDEVVPLLDLKSPAIPEIKVTGRFWGDRQVSMPKPLRYCGVIDNYVDVLSSSTFMIAPTAIGTGQQIKIFEALALGIPVVSYKSAVPADVLEANPSIIAVDTPSEFASMLNRLFLDEQCLCHYADLALEAADRQAREHASRPYSSSLRKIL